LVAYIVTSHDLAWHLQTSLDRVVFQPTLVVVLLGTIYLGLLLDRRSPEVGGTRYEVKGRHQEAPDLIPRTFYLLPRTSTFIPDISPSYPQVIPRSRRGARDYGLTA